MGKVRKDLNMVNIRFYLLLILVIICVNISCDNKNKNDITVVFNYFHSFWPKETSYTDSILYTLMMHEFDDYITFEYQNESQREIFCINFSKNDGYMVRLNDTTELHYMESLKYIDNQTDTIEIFKFVTMSHAIDGDAYYYITSKYGVILGMSTTWPNFSVLSKHTMNKSKDIIHSMTSVILFDEMFSALLQIEQPPPPPSPPSNGWYHDILDIVTH